MSGTPSPSFTLSFSWVQRNTNWTIDPGDGSSVLCCVRGVQFSEQEVIVSRMHCAQLGNHWCPTDRTIKKYSQRLAKEAFHKDMRLLKYTHGQHWETLVFCRLGTYLIRHLSERQSEIANYREEIHTIIITSEWEREREKNERWKVSQGVCAHCVSTIVRKVRNRRFRDVYLDQCAASRDLQRVAAVFFIEVVNRSMLSFELMSVEP